jgi:stage II sporulation protein D
VRFSLIASLVICVVVLAWAALPGGGRHSSFSLGLTTTNAEQLDQRLQQAATLALGDRRGTVIVMDPQTGRIRAVVNPEIAVRESFPLGSAIKPFTALAAFQSGVIDEDSRTLCHEKYSHHAFQTTCSHPRDLPPLNPTEAIAYSCNYYFSTVGEHLKEESFSNTLSKFGFGKKSGVNFAGELPGELQRSEWRPQNAIGESDYLQATPIQVINAYAAMVNGGRLFIPRIGEPGEPATVQAKIEIKDSEREAIVKGMRGAVRYGSAEKANLYSLPVYIFGKTGTATQLGGFRTHGWFVGIASAGDKSAGDSEAAPDKVNLAVLVFLAKGYGFEAAEVARPIFAEAAAEISNLKSEIQSGDGAAVSEGSRESSAVPKSVTDSRSQSPNSRSLPASVTVHLVRENITRAVPFEDYVRGVVAVEGSTETEPDALKALAIAVRTYALRNLGRHARDGYDFCNSTHCERYRPVDQDSGGYVSPRVLEAVEATEGQILSDESNEPADSYFSASCGGATANMATLWGGNAPPYLRGVHDEYCVTEAHKSWTDTIPQTRLLKALQSDPRTNIGDRLRDVSVLRRDASGRAELIAIDGNRRVTVKGWDFKIIVGRSLGWNVLKSSRFEIARAGSNFIFRGQGFGHGLGLCQEGAHVMAERGASYRQILAKYFPTTHLTNLNGAASADLIWGREIESGRTQRETSRSHNSSRLTLRSEDFRISYPGTVSQREVEGLLSLLQSSRKSLLARAAAAGIKVQFPALEVFVNETTGDYVGRSGLPAWTAAATKGNRIELQPLETLRRRRILETTVRHELVHTLVDIVSRGRAPRWLAEGLALHLAGEGRLLARYEPRKKMSVEEIEMQLGSPAATTSANDLRTVYAAAYGEVKRLIKSEGEAGVWKRLAN